MCGDRYRRFAKISLTPFVLFLVSAPAKLEFMTRGYVTAELDRIRGVPAYNIKLTTELDTEDEEKQPPAKATRKEKKKRGRKPKISKMQHSRQVISDIPEDMPEWEGRGVGMAETFNLCDMNQLLKLNKYLYDNGNWELFTTPKNGSCVFASIRRGLEAPEEFRNTHLDLW